jgi:hypothetical protein
LLVKLEVNDEAETIPLQILGSTIAIGKMTNRITYSPWSREGRREMGEGIDVFAWDFRGCLPVIQSKPEGNMLLESDVANKDRPVESSGSRPGKGQRLDVDVGVGIGGIGEWGRLIGVDDRK